jgi:hypothetical protein
VSTYFATCAAGFPGRRPAAGNMPLCSACPASERAFSRVAAGGTAADGATFTSVRMPLVGTPVIGPTEVYDGFPATPERAGFTRLVLRAAR